MALIDDFQANPLFAEFVEPKYDSAIVEEMLTIAEDGLENHRQCMGIHFSRCVFFLAAHRLVKFQASGMTRNSVTDLSVAEMRQVVSSLSVSDEAGSESITFQSNPTSGAGSSGLEDFESTQFGILYLTFYNQYKCPRTWMVA